MTRGGSLRSIVIGALIGVGFVVPSSAHASSPLTLTLTATPTTAFEDQPITLSVQTTPVVSGLSITFADVGGVFFQLQATTDDSGVASATLLGAPNHLPDTEPVVVGATSALTDEYDAATSNTVDLHLNRHPSSVVVTATDVGGNPIITTSDDLYIHVRVAVATCDGEVLLQQIQSGVVTISSGSPVSMVANDDGTRSCGADFREGQWPLGTLEFSAAFGGSWINLESQSAVLEVPITLIVTSTALQVSINPVEAGSLTFLTATVSATKGGVDNTGTVTFFDGGTSLGSASLGGLSGPASNKAGVYASFPTTGVHELHATWNGTILASPSTSPDVPITVTPDVVSVVNVGVSSPTLYPVIDGYLDTVSIHGELNEPASIVITITSLSTHAVVAQFDVPNRGATSWEVDWDGRTALAAPYAVARHGGPLPLGKLVPAGTYRVTQVITDLLGTKLSVSDDLVVSLKAVHWYTGSVTLAGDHTSATGGSYGSVQRSTTYAGGLRISLAFYTGTPWEAAGYQFTLPSAAEYSAISFAVLGKGTAGAALGLQDRQFGTWPSGHAWVINDFALAPLPGSYGWTTFIGDPVYDRIGRTVRGTVFLTGESSNHYDVAEVRLSYRYGILK